MKLADYVANIPSHQKEGRSYSHVDHDDLRRWLEEIEEIRQSLWVKIASCRLWSELGEGETVEYDAYHDDPPCSAKLDSGGMCPECRIVPDTQSISLKKRE